MKWFEESLHGRWRQRLRIERVLHRGQSGFQDLLVFENGDFGRVLVLDGVVQTTEADEFVYHEMLVHVPLMAHGRAREVLIIGGGDGGTLREVLKHGSVERATMIELDPAVVDVAAEHLPALSAGAFDDPRSEVLFEDGVRFVAATERTFDAIIIDSTDPIGPGEVLFTEDFYRDCRRRLRPGGVLANQSGNLFGEHVHLDATQARLRAVFPAVGLYRAAVPTYFGGDFTFGLASDDRAILELGPDDLAARPLPAGLRQYSPATHLAAFVHPPWLQALLAA